MLNEHAITKGSKRTGEQGVPIATFCSSHKRRGNDRGQYQSEGTELICGDTPLLDGRYPSAEREGDWMTKVDLKDAYFMILMSPAH